MNTYAIVKLVHKSIIITWSQCCMHVQACEVLRVHGGVSKIEIMSYCGL